MRSTLVYLVVQTKQLQNANKYCDIRAAAVLGATTES
jgi:hypothetical protein